MSKKSYNFAIIGAGVIGKSHAKMLRQVEQGTLVAICDIIPEKAKALAEQYECNWYNSIEEMLENETIDIVTICTPSGMHADHTIQAVRAGKHVISEKPMDVTLEKARMMIEECRKANRKLAVISQHRFDAATIEVKKDIDDGKFGKVIVGNGAINWYRSQSYYDSGDWRGTWELDGGGALMNQGIHTIDVLQYLAGDIESVYAHCETMGHERIEVEDAAVATLRYKNGAIGTLVGTTCAFPGLSTRIEVFGKDGSAVIENDLLVHKVFRDDIGEVGNYGGVSQLETKEEVNETGASEPAAISQNSHILQFKDFIEAIEENREPKVNGLEAIKPLKVILAIYQSSKIGEQVQIDEI